MLFLVDNIIQQYQTQIEVSWNGGTPKRMLYDGNSYSDGCLQGIRYPLFTTPLRLISCLLVLRRYLVPLEEVKTILDEFKQIDTSAPVSAEDILGPPERQTSVVC